MDKTILVVDNEMVIRVIRESPLGQRFNTACLENGEQACFVGPGIPIFTLFFCQFLLTF